MWALTVLSPTLRRFPTYWSVLDDEFRSQIPLRDSLGFSPSSLLRRKPDRLSPLTTLQFIEQEADFVKEILTEKLIWGFVPIKRSFSLVGRERVIHKKIQELVFAVIISC